MVKKEYGRHVADYKWCSKGALVDRCLEVYTTKTGVKALLWNSDCKGWREEPHHPIWSSMIWHPMNDEGVSGCYDRLVAYCKEKFNMPDDVTLQAPFHPMGTLNKKEHKKGIKK